MTSVPIHTIVSLFVLNGQSVIKGRTKVPHPRIKWCAWAWGLKTRSHLKLRVVAPALALISEPDLRSRFPLPVYLARARELWNMGYGISALTSLERVFVFAFVSISEVKSRKVLLHPCSLENNRGGPPKDYPTGSGSACKGRSQVTYFSDTIRQHRENRTNRRRT